MHAKIKLLPCAIGLMLSSCGVLEEPRIELTAPQQICPAFPAAPLAKKPEAPSMIDWLSSLGGPS